MGLLLVPLGTSAWACKDAFTHLSISNHISCAGLNTRTCNLSFNILVQRELTSNNMVRTALKRPGISEVGPKRPYIPFEALKRP